MKYTYYICVLCLYAYVKWIYYMHLKYVYYAMYIPDVSLLSVIVCVYYASEHNNYMCFACLHTLSYVLCIFIYLKYMCLHIWNTFAVVSPHCLSVCVMCFINLQICVRHVYSCKNICLSMSQYEKEIIIVQWYKSYSFCLTV